MLLFIYAITFVFTTVGLYTIVSDQLELASNKAVKVALAFNKKSDKDKDKDVILTTISANLAKLIRMDPYKRKKFEADLKSLNISMSPEVYKALAIVKSGSILIGVIPCLMFIPILSFAFIGAAFITYFKSDSDIKEQLRKMKEDIEFELPRFASTLKQELSSSRDVLTILENYKKNAGGSLQRELDITVADMRSGNYEAALLRFEGRVSISALSDIIRGLIGVLRGDNNVTYFEMLSHDLDVLEIQRLENIAQKQPGKIKKYLFLLLMCTLVMYVTILGVYAFIMVQ
jgi:Flp pilus assembly protein TadB